MSNLSIRQRITSERLAPGAITAFVGAVLLIVPAGIYYLFTGPSGLLPKFVINLIERAANWRKGLKDDIEAASPTNIKLDHNTKA